MRPVPYHKRERFKALIEEMRDAGIIRPNKSEYCSPVHIINKEDGSIRFTVDYKTLNSITIKDCYPTPIIRDILYTLKGAKYFSKIDLASGYFQIQMHPNSMKYTAFRCEFGFFEYTVLPMGLRIRWPPSRE